MPKSLILYRHAKSDWGAESNSDHERPLNERGIDSAEIMGKVLALANQVPELVITSTAVRAKETLILSVESGEWKCDVEEDSRIYHEDTSTVIEIIKSVSNKYDDIMLVGHEPKWSMLASTFIGGGQINFPTACMAKIEFDINNWEFVDARQGILKWLLQPSFFRKGKFEF
ncbi:MAG TPA: histidine phosphatase family protein [Thermodesulfobacteriota bacterium]|nr:histidine phosphatase family protein [Thermodesulfobacteriota bacterium]